MEVIAGLLIVALVIQQWLHVRERAELLDRIQAPETVITRRAPEPSGEDLFVDIEDPEKIEEYQRERGEF